MTAREIIETLSATPPRNLDSEVTCRILFRNSMGTVVRRQTAENYRIVDGELLVDARVN